MFLQNYLKNLFEVYVKIYFPTISFEELKDIIDYLNGKKTVELNRIIDINSSILNDLIVENEIMVINMRNY